MKYYGSVYLGNIDIYNMQELKEFDDPYQALDRANSEWNADPEKQIARLLIVFRKSETSDEISTANNAYFQFTDSNACKMFIKNKSEIKWSKSDEQIWNGNAQMM